MKNNLRFRQMWTWLTLLALMIGLLGVTPLVTHARSIEPAPRSSLRPIGTLLNPDGTLNLRSGYSGSLDVHGWRMTTTVDGTPHFIAAGSDAPHKPVIAGDEWWDGEFQLGGATAFRHTSDGCRRQPVANEVEGDLAGNGGSGVQQRQRVG